MNETNTKKRGAPAFSIPEGVVVDWTKTDKELGLIFNKSALTIMNLRKRIGAPKNKRGRRLGVKLTKVVGLTTVTETVVPTIEPVLPASASEAA